MSLQVDWLYYRLEELENWRSLGSNLSRSLLDMGRITLEEHLDREKKFEEMHNEQVKKVRDEYRNSKGVQII